MFDPGKALFPFTLHVPGLVFMMQVQNVSGPFLYSKSGTFSRNFAARTNRIFVQLCELSKEESSSNGLQAIHVACG